MSLITPHLFLGGLKPAQNFNFLKNKRVKLIVNCAMELPNYFPENFEYIRLDWDDIPQQNILQDLDRISNKIIKTIRDQNVVFVHCAAGISRSSSVVIYTIMKLHKWDYNKSYQFVKDFRSIISPNPGFVEQIQQMQLHGNKEPPSRTKVQDSILEKQSIQSKTPEKPQIDLSLNTNVTINGDDAEKSWSKLTFDCKDCEAPKFVSTKSSRQGRGIYARVFT